MDWRAMHLNDLLREYSTYLELNRLILFYKLKILQNSTAKKADHLIFRGLQKLPPSRPLI
jgi:hypothetical protein